MRHRVTDRAARRPRPGTPSRSGTTRRGRAGTPPPGRTRPAGRSGATGWPPRPGAGGGRIVAQRVEVLDPVGLDPAGQQPEHPDALGTPLVGQLLDDHGQPGPQPVGRGQSTDRRLDRGRQHPSRPPGRRRCRRVITSDATRRPARKTDSNASRHCSSVVSSTEPAGGPPTLISAPSSRPNRSRASEHASAAVPGSARSAVRAAARSSPSAVDDLGQHLVAAGDQHHPGPLGDQLLGVARPEPAAGGGDHENAIGQPQIHDQILARGPDSSAPRPCAAPGARADRRG